MIVTINLFTVTKKTSFADAIHLLNSIELAARSFNRLSARRYFISGCLNACGFNFCSNFASRFSKNCNISADNKVYRLCYSCSSGRWHQKHCYDIDLSSFK